MVYFTSRETSLYETVKRKTVEMDKSLYVLSILFVLRLTSHEMRNISLALGMVGINETVWPFIGVRNLTLMGCRCKQIVICLIPSILKLSSISFPPIVL